MFLRLYLLASHHAAQIMAQNQVAGVRNNTTRADRKVFKTFFIMTIFLTLFNLPIIFTLGYHAMTRHMLPVPYQYLAQIMVYSNNDNAL